MKPIKKIDQFAYKSSFDSELSTFLPVGSEVTFKDRAQQQLIYGINTELVEFPIIYYGDEVRHFRFDESEFSKVQLIEYSKLFHFNLVPHKYHPEILIGSLDTFNDEYLMNCYGAIVEADGRHYLLIYAKRGTTSFEDNVVFVHGIWEIECQL